MSVPTGIDSDAPVSARHQIDINAPLDTVWRLQADVNGWPAWQTDITAARLDGPFEPGSSFTWTTNGYFTVTSTIYAVAERARTLWGRPRARRHGHPRVGLHPDTHRHPRGHAGILQRPARRSRPHRAAIDPGQVTDRLAWPPESHRRIHKLTSADPGVHLRHDPVRR